LGSVAAGIASVGGSLAQAKELQRQEAIEKIKLALEQSRLGTEQSQQEIARQYAGIAGIREKREQAEFEERKRLAMQPKFIGSRVVGGRLYSGVQDPKDGSIKYTEVTGVDTAQDAQALEEELQGLPANIQDMARREIYPDILANDYVGARRRLATISQKVIEGNLPGKATVTDTTQTNVVDTPQGPAIITTPKRTITRKVPEGSAPKVGGGPAPSPSTLTNMLGLPKGTRVIGIKPATRAEITKIISPVGEADKRYLIMLDAVKHPNPQNDVALTFNHIGMTLSAQRGARITNAEIDRAIISRSLPEDLQALYTRVVNGQFLTPQERQNMLGLAIKNRTLIWQEAWEQAKAERIANKMPRTMPGLQPVPGVHFIGEDVTVKGQGRSRVTDVHPDGSIKVKPY
jgi:hypothetical protein